MFFPFLVGAPSPTTTSAPSLREDRPERFPTKFSVSPGYHTHPKFSSSFLSLSLSQHNHPKFYSLLSHSPNSGCYNSGSGRCSHITGSSCVCSFFFRLGGGPPLHKLQSIVVVNPWGSRLLLASRSPARWPSCLSR
jgi:hypothetical protein